MKEFEDKKDGLQDGQSRADAELELMLKALELSLIHI